MGFDVYTLADAIKDLKVLRAKVDELTMEKEAAEEKAEGQAFTIARLRKIADDYGAQLDDAWRELAHHRPSRSFTSLPKAIRREMNGHYPEITWMAEDLAKDLNLDSDRKHCAFRGLGGSAAQLHTAYQDQYEIYHQLHEMVQRLDVQSPKDVKRYPMFLIMAPSLGYANLDIYQCKLSDLSLAVRCRAQNIANAIDIIVKELQ